jgi:hypothetical protein
MLDGVSMSEDMARAHEPFVERKVGVVVDAAISGRELLLAGRLSKITPGGSRVRERHYCRSLP